MQCLDQMASADPANKSALRRPHMSVLPLGTGNDIARVLGWGPGFNNEPLNSIIADTMAAAEVKIDRWEVKITPFDGVDPVHHVFNNYLSIGFCDAKVSLNFHSMRDENPGLFFHRGMNKFWYAAHGGKVALEGIFERKLDLSKILDLEIDKKPVDLSDLRLEGLILLNVPSYAGGTNLWGMRKQDEFQSVSFSDGVLECIGITSLTHFAQIKAGLSEGLRLGQGKSVTISFKDSSHPLPGKIDGEPWLQTKQAIYEIKFLSSDPVLAKKASCGDRCFGARKVGWMKKQNLGIWKPRFFVVNQKLLTYYLTQEDAIPRGQIDLTKSIISLGKSDAELQVKENNRVYTLQCDPYHESAHEWVSACIAEATLGQRLEALDGFDFDETSESDSGANLTSSTTASSTPQRKKSLFSDIL